MEPAILRVLPAENRAVGSFARNGTRSPTCVPSRSVMRSTELAGAVPAQPVPPVMTCMELIAGTSVVGVGANGTTGRRRRPNGPDERGERHGVRRTVGPDHRRV